MIPILSQVNPLHTPQTNLPKVHFDPILPSMRLSYESSYNSKCKISYKFFGTWVVPKNPS
jgi:hypothetical protein